MTRSVILGNGALSVLMDQGYVIREVYYPLTTENNANALRIGVWCDGDFSWFSELSPEIGYLDDTLVSVASASFKGVSLKFYDCVDFAYNVLVRRCELKTQKECRVFFAFDYKIDGHDEGDTALYDPATSSIIHYKESRWFVFSSNQPFFEYATGYKQTRGLVGTWKDCEDGRLSGNPIAQGAVDSAVSFRFFQDSSFYSWIVASRDLLEAKRVNDYVRTKSADELMKRTANYWRAWLSVSKAVGDFSDALKRSALIIACHCQNNGAIPASLDTDIMRFNRDTYNYVWPRDAGSASLALTLLGYLDLSRGVFRFLFPLIMREGCMFQKYTVEGHWGSTWHPWTQGFFPIQEDETAIIVHALWQHFSRFQDVDFVKPYYRPGIKAAADFLLNFRDKKLGLPLPSYDLWEERFGTHLYTCACVYAGLKAASNFTRFFGELELARKYESVAEEVKAGIDAMWLGDHFARSVKVENSKIVGFDETIDASSLLLPQLGVYPADHPKVVQNARVVEQKLSVAGGIARYENDTYLKTSEQPNPWVITTLWLAEQKALTRDLEGARRLIQWVLSKALKSGVLPEQVTPKGDYPSVTPLVWSHAELIRAIVMLNS
ncbi:glucan 1,3-alpha-glucosidase [Candidatus Marsarchaeota G2 archaeon ECH_B_SAG-G06]|uniref:Glucan 1,3-alpha-glucosidase n=1 Tax=Candidatus Marsarchaeota G2 archaeon ECH_B_SAG-G06 TaxID=1978166 RepID=A0A2R6BYQ6_9ARCH|nr:MAG: glucan 1,3-alpha-glucosidase [Candidatus Marsarchaeota G2 archaeon ECH_B_SAG-G06]